MMQMCGRCGRFEENHAPIGLAINGFLCGLCMHEVMRQDNQGHAS